MSVESKEKKESRRHEMASVETTRLSENVHVVGHDTPRYFRIYGKTVDQVLECQNHLELLVKEGCTPDDLGIFEITETGEPVDWPRPPGSADKPNDAEANCRAAWDHVLTALSTLATKHEPATSTLSTPSTPHPTSTTTTTTTSSGGSTTTTTTTTSSCTVQ